MRKFDRKIIRKYGIPEELIIKTEGLAKKLNNWDRKSRILAISHRDGDGISAASVIYQALTALNFTDFEIRILLSPDIEQLMEYINELDPKYVITADIGAEFSNILDKEVDDYIITDHHPTKSGKYGRNQLNPIEFGLNDEFDASGSTMVFLLFYPLFKQFFWNTLRGRVIFCYALSGAISDFQIKPTDNPGCVNKFVLDLAVQYNAITLKKDISLFGRSVYPVYLCIYYANIPGFGDMELSNILINSEIEGKLENETDDNYIWKRIVDLTDEEKSKLLEIITRRLSDMKIESPLSILKDEIVGRVIDLVALEGFDCTLLEDGRYTLDPREILHRVNYCCRRGFSNLAIELLNNKHVQADILLKISDLHKEGDTEVARALALYEQNEIPMWSWDGRIVLLDFTGNIFYDEVGVVAGVIMKADKDIQIILSACERDDDEGLMKLSIRAREIVWNSIDSTNNMSDAKRIFIDVKKNNPDNIVQFGGHRWALSSSIKRKAMHKIFEQTKKYFKELKDPQTDEYLINK
ncbi:MAG: hypothetical protein GF329_13680 [Candidatus Lokiarchaeota archaeon]|nr:hypothetical protein [Candidatus Lokiarchaeota archaeon]